MNHEPIRLMHYDPSWRQEFQQTRSSILHSCEGWVSEVHHIGSTAISGLIARPIIDCAAVVTEMDGLEQATMLIEGLNYRVQENPEWLNSGRLLAKPRSGQTSHHVYLFVAGDDVYTRMLAIRDKLREDSELAVQFEESKVLVWREYEGDGQRYQAAKETLFAAL